MSANLFKLMFFHPLAEFPTEMEFIVVSNHEDARDSEVKRISTWYEAHVGKPVDRMVLSPPLPIDDLLYSEDRSTPADWSILQERVREERTSRPRGTGCIFTGPSEQLAASISSCDIADLKDSIRYFMNEQRVAGPQYVFVGSTWNSETRMRTGIIKLFEASSIQLAASIVHLHYLELKPVLTLTDWCCPIYVV